MDYYAVTKQNAIEHYLMVYIDRHHNMLCKRKGCPYDYFYKANTHIYSFTYLQYKYIENGCQDTCENVHGGCLQLVGTVGNHFAYLICKNFLSTCNYFCKKNM